MRLLLALGLLLSALIANACNGSSSSSGPQSSTPAATATRESTPTLSPPPRPTIAPFGLQRIGHYELVAPADVWASGETAYVGARCDGGGVAIVDVSDPASPRNVGRAADHLSTSAEDVMVIDARTASFTGKLLAAGLQGCAPNPVQGLKGVDLWDVTDPANPARLGFFDVGPLPSGGVHELFLFQRGDRIFALLAVPRSEAFHPGGLGDLRIVEVTDPRNPVQLADWGAGKDGGLAFGTVPTEDIPEDPDPRSRCEPPATGVSPCRGDIPWVVAHSASASGDGTRAFLSYWDAGMIVLDISDPSTPILLSHATTPEEEEGNLHSAIDVPGRDLAITTDEDFVDLDGDGETAPGDVWGGTRIWDISDVAAPRQIGSIARPASAATHPEGLHTVHNPEVVGDLLYLSWYTDGVRVVDISDPASPREVAAYVPPEMEYEGQLYPPFVWGVHVENDLVFLSDMSSGLHILARTP